MTSGGRTLAVTMVILLTGMLSNVPTALAIEPPTVDPALVPPDGAPGPEQPMRQSNVCARTIAVAEPHIGLPAPGFSMLNVSKAWQHSTGNGVTVAVIDTGVNPNPRLPVLAGGDYIMGGDGLSDCDAHGTVVASLIAAAPSGTPMPAPLPLKPAFPMAVGNAPTGRTSVAPSSAPLEMSAMSPPSPVTPDGVAGVAPHATVISIRQSSRAFEPQNPGPGDMDARRKAGTVSTLARAIVHAANMGAKVINVSVTACVSAADPLDQRSIGAAGGTPRPSGTPSSSPRPAMKGRTVARRIRPSIPSMPKIPAVGETSGRCRRRPGSRTMCCPSALSTPPAPR